MFVFTAMQDIRWQQRLTNFSSALQQLRSAIKVAEERDLSDLETQGLIQAFEFTHELAWKVLKDYFEFQGNTQITGSRDATREAFKVGLIADGHGWMEMIQSRNQTTHTYHRATAQEIAGRTMTLYFPLFEIFEKKMVELKNQ